MWVYIQSEPSLWTVGFYAPDGEWHTDSDHSDREQAAARVAHLNGDTAAALELMEAARGVDVLYAEMQAALPVIANKPGWDIVQQAVKQARAAIAKAEGSPA